MPACDRPGIKRLAVLPAAASARGRGGRGWAASHRRRRLCLGLVKPCDDHGQRRRSTSRDEGINHPHHPQSQPPLLPPHAPAFYSLQHSLLRSTGSTFSSLSLLVIPTARPVIPHSLRQNANPHHHHEIPPPPHPHHPHHRALRPRRRRPSRHPRPLGLRPPRPSRRPRRPNPRRPPRRRLRLRQGPPPPTSPPTPPPTNPPPP